MAVFPRRVVLVPENRETYTPVGKKLLYSGNHLNLEGLALGPQLGTDRYVVLGVVDNGGLFANPLVSFVLTVPEPSTASLMVWLIPLLLRRRSRAG